MKLEHAHESSRYRVCYTTDGKETPTLTAAFENTFDAEKERDRRNEDEDQEGQWVVLEEIVFFSRSLRN